MSDCFLNLKSRLGCRCCLYCINKDVSYVILQNSTKEILADLYGGDLSSMDMFILMLVEKDNSTGLGPGYIVKKVIEKQITRLRDADYFWVENKVNR